MPERRGFARRVVPPRRPPRSSVRSFASIRSLPSAHEQRIFKRSRRRIASDKKEPARCVGYTGERTPHARMCGGYQGPKPLWAAHARAHDARASSFLRATDAPIRARVSVVIRENVNQSRGRSSRPETAPRLRSSLSRRAAFRLGREAANRQACDCDRETFSSDRLSDLRTSLVV